MVCVHTTHFAVVLSPLECDEPVTEYSAPQWGQKNGLPSGIGPVRGTSATPHRQAIMSPQGDKFKPGLGGAGIAAALRNAGTLRYMAALRRFVLPLRAELSRASARWSLADRGTVRIGSPCSSKCSFD
jgi:hypothetical protein